MTPEERQFISQAAVSARMIGHPFSDMAACEAALESAYGQSLLAKQGNNLFGMKQRQHPIYGTLALPTREFQSGGWTIIQAEFVKYPALEDCFADRLATLTRLASVYPNYKAALEAQSPEDYINAVSKTWSTDPNRAAKCLAIYQEYEAGAEQAV
jgi:flagellum-specific peptidoglycan hydrolase FlgJ